MKHPHKRLTYANVMSTIAVFLVLGGATAFAATKIGSGQLKANSVLTGKIKKEAVTTSKIKNGAVVTSKIANDAVTGAQVNVSTLGQVPSAATAVTAAPRAFAHVLSNSEGGGVDNAKGITAANVTYAGSGVYCFELGFTPTNVQATVDWFGGLGNSIVQADIGKYVLCPEGSDASVRTTNSAAAGINTTKFYVSFVG